MENTNMVVAAQYSILFISVGFLRKFFILYNYDFLDLLCTVRNVIISYPRGFFLNSRF